MPADPDRLLIEQTRHLRTLVRGATDELRATAARSAGLQDRARRPAAEFFSDRVRRRSRRQAEDIARAGALRLAPAGAGH